MSDTKQTRRVRIHLKAEDWLAVEQLKSERGISTTAKFVRQAIAQDLLAAKQSQGRSKSESGLAKAVA